MLKTLDVLSYIGGLSEESVEFVNWPIYYNEDKYHQSICKVVDYLSRFKEVVGVYQIGGVNDPGISDIDLIVVFDNDVNSFNHSYRVVFEKKDSYLFMHGIYGMARYVFEMKDLLIPIYDSNILLGENILVEESLIGEEKKALANIYALEYLMINLFNLAAQFFLRRLKVRNLLCSLKGLAYDFNILSEGNYNKEQKAFYDRLSSLRKSWWSREIDLRSEFYALCKEGMELSLKTLCEFSISTGGERLSEKAPPYIHVGANGYLTPRSYKDIFISSIEFRRTNAINLMDKLLSLNSQRILRNQLIDAKTAFYAIFLKVPFSLFSIFDGQANGFYKTVLEKRRALLEKYSEFMKGINPEYSIYDIFRWYNSKNVKWNIIRSLNKYIFIN